MLPDNNALTRPYIPHSLKQTTLRLGVEFVRPMSLQVLVVSGTMVYPIPA